MTRNYAGYKKDRSSSGNLSSNQVKTTDINILLNSVRLDKKKNIKKKILFSLLLVGLLSSVTIFLII